MTPYKNRGPVFKIIVIVIAISCSFPFSWDCTAEDTVILSSKKAVNWLIKNHYVRPDGIPLDNLHVFRSRVLGSEGPGPAGLYALAAEGWTMHGKLNKPIKNPVITVAKRSVITGTPKIDRLWNWEARCGTLGTFRGTFTITALTAAGNIKGAFGGGGHVGNLNGSISGSYIRFQRTWTRTQTWEGQLIGNTIQGTVTDPTHPQCTFTAW